MSHEESPQSSPESESLMSDDERAQAAEGLGLLPDADDAEIAKALIDSMISNPEGDPSALLPEGVDRKLVQKYASVEDLSKIEELYPAWRI